MATILEAPSAARKPASKTTPDGGKPRRRRIGWVKITPYLLILPAILFELLVHVIPMIVGVWMSFIQLTQFYITNWTSAPFAGLGNFRVALDFNGPLGQQLGVSFLITLAFTILTVGFSFCFGMAASIVLQRKFRGRGVIRTLFLIPYALPAYAGIITWKFMFQRDTGFLNELIVHTLHLTDSAPFWLIGNNAFWSLIVVSVWQQWPFAFLMTMAGMQSIPEELYEAAAIDGASTWQQVRHITLGMLRPVNSVLLLLLFLWTFREFNTPFVLFGAAPSTSANLLVVNIYQASFIQWNFGRGAAMSVLLMVFLIIVASLWALWNRRVQRNA
jgi:multiple sugar transport system permease protein